MIVLPVPSLLSSPVLAELQQAELVSSEVCEELSDISGVVRVQRGKSPEVISKTAHVMRRHGFEEESKLLAGRQSRPSSICLSSIHLLVLHCTVEHPYDGHLVTSITIH